MMRESKVDYEEFDEEEYIVTPEAVTPETSLETMTDVTSASLGWEGDSEKTDTASEDEMRFLDSLRSTPVSVLSDGEVAHPLLEESTPAYSNMTVRRAFIVWAHGGQANEFKQVCNYYHRLEAVEKTMTPEQRLQSRLPEFDLLTSGPPRSQFQMNYFPNLYGPSDSTKNTYYGSGNMSFEDRVFTLEGFLDLQVHNGVTTKEVLTTSEIIRKYCREHRQTLKTLLCQYQTYNKKCGIKNSLCSLSIYVKKLFLKDELELYYNIRNMPQQFNFLDDDGDVRVKPFARAIERPKAVKQPKIKINGQDSKKPNVCQTLLSTLPKLSAEESVRAPKTQRSVFTATPQSSSVLKSNPQGKVWGSQSSSIYMSSPQRSSTYTPNPPTTVWGAITSSPTTQSSSVYLQSSQSPSMFARNSQATLWCPAGTPSSSVYSPSPQAASVFSPNCGALWGPSNNQHSSMFIPSPQTSSVFTSDPSYSFICSQNAQQSSICSPSPQRSLMSSPCAPCGSNGSHSTSFSPQPIPSCNLLTLSAYSPQFKAFMAKFMKAGEIQSM